MKYQETKIASLESVHQYVSKILWFDSGGGCRSKNLMDQKLQLIKMQNICSLENNYFENAHRYQLPKDEVCSLK